MNKISCDTADQSDSNYDFLREKNYEGARIGLQIPTGILVNVLKQLEVEYTNIIDAVIHKEGVKSKLVSTLIKNQAVDSLSCSTCHLGHAVVHLMVNIRLHHTIRQTNNKLRDQKDRKNRKVLKFSHL